MALLPQSRLGRYEILAPLDEGGMGQVYRARDPKLGREVAIKLLKDGRADDPDWLSRFEREAAHMAALTHANIAAVYEFGEADGVPFLVMELVCGETLAKRLDRGPLPVEGALNVCRQVAEAVEAAHERGLIHRDLKPANVMITPEGKVKVLDFGLAKAASAPLLVGPAAPTIEYRPLSGPGLIVGTPRYMSPEQARGEAVDRRCDVWALGCILYECVSGRPAFDGQVQSDVLAAVLRDDPKWEALPAAVPSRVADLIRRCLHKKVQRRLRDVGDARLEIEEALADLDRPPAVRLLPSPPPTRARRSPVGVAAAGVVAVAAFALGLWAGGRRSEAPPSPETAPSDWEAQLLLGGTTRAFGPRVSPNGQYLAYVVLHDGQAQVGLMNLGTGEVRVLTRDKTRGGIVSLSWSNDSSEIWYDRFLDVPTGISSVSVFGDLPADGKDKLPIYPGHCPQVLPSGPSRADEPRDQGGLRPRGPDAAPRREARHLLPPPTAVGFFAQGGRPWQPPGGRLDGPPRPPPRLRPPESDDALLVTKINAQGNYTIWRSWPGTARPDEQVFAHAVQFNRGFEETWWPSALRPLHREDKAVFCGRVIDEKNPDTEPPRKIYLLDLATGEPEILHDGPIPHTLIPLAVSPDDRYVYVVLPADDLYRVVRVPLADRSEKSRTVLTVMDKVYQLDIGPDGQLFLDQFRRPWEAIRFSPDDGKVEHVASPARGPAAPLVELSDGRLLLPSKVSGRDRLLLAASGKDPTPLLEKVETRPPTTRVGADRLAVVAGQPGKDEKVMLLRVQGNLIQPLQELKHVPTEGLTALAASPDERTLYFVRNKVVWHVPLKDGTPDKIAEGDGVAVHPNGKELLLQRFEGKGVELSRVPLNDGKPSGKPEAFEPDGGWRIAPDLIGGNAINETGQVVVTITHPDNWFWKPALLDLKTKQLTRVRVDYEFDVYWSNWGKGGSVVSMACPLKSELWRFTPK